MDSDSADTFISMCIDFLRFQVIAVGTWESESELTIMAEPTGLKDACLVCQRTNVECTICVISSFPVPRGWMILNYILHFCITA